MLDGEALRREAASTGFRPEALEKVLRLFDLLEGIRGHPFLKTRVVLKGGTALNLFVLDLPRLSVDIDLNYIGGADRGILLEERPKVEQALQSVCGRSGIQVRRVPEDHAGGKWRLSTTGAGGRPMGLELDMNFLLRTPLWRPFLADSKKIGPFGVTQVPMLDPHELAAGKLAALFGRMASRDLYDVRGLLRSVPLDRGKLRLGFLVYGGVSRRDWRTVSLDDIRSDPKEVDQELLPLLRTGGIPPRGEIAPWSRRLAEESRELLSGLLPLTAPEIEFLDRLNDRGEIAPELLTGDEGLRATIRSHPGLLWKTQNVRSYKGLK
jgi:hypothetical protein